jgi:hypothetical protein
MKIPSNTVAAVFLTCEREINNWLEICPKNGASEFLFNQIKESGAFDRLWEASDKELPEGRTREDFDRLMFLTFSKQYLAL